MADGLRTTKKKQTQTLGTPEVTLSGPDFSQVMNRLGREGPESHLKRPHSRLLWLCQLQELTIRMRIEALHFRKRPHIHLHNFKLGLDWR